MSGTSIIAQIFVPLSIIFAGFQCGTVKDTYRLLQLRACVRMCVKSDDE